MQYLNHNEIACETLGIDVATPDKDYMDEDFDDVPEDYISPLFIAFIV